jgi:hypothetical protein
MTNLTTLFFQLLQVSIGKRIQLDCSPNQYEWAQLFAMAKKQSLAGICFAGVEKLPKEQSPGEDLIMDWMGEAVKIQRRNSKLNNACKKLCEEFEGKGCKTCVLKGQSNRVYYPNDLASRRTPGDVDIWLFPKYNLQSPVKQTMELLEGENRIVSLAYLHAELKQMDSVAIEAHFRPTFLNEPTHNYRLQKWYRENKFNCIMKQQIADDITIPMLKPVYNIIFQLVHIYRHLLDEGIGLRQLLDYYFLLTGTVKALTSEERKLIDEKLSSFGLRRIAEAVMYVLQEVFLMDKSYMIVPDNEKYGKQLLNEIMIAGNFGHYDPRLKDIGAASHNTSYQVRHAIRRFTRNTRFFMAYPSEVIFEPFARVIHFWWRRFKLWRY